MVQQDQVLDLEIENHQHHQEMFSFLPPSDSFSLWNYPQEDLIEEA